MSEEDTARALAVAWADAVRGTSFVSLERDELETLLSGLAARLLVATLADRPDERVAADVGREMIDAHFTTPASLQHTMASLGEGLCAHLDAVTGGHNSEGRVGAVMGALAAGYSEGLQELTRTEQEHITSAALTALREAEAAKWQTEARYGALFADAHIGISIAAEHLDPRDVAVARRDELLNQRGLIEPEIDPAFFDRTREVLGAIEAHDAGAAAADVGLDDHGEA